MLLYLAMQIFYSDHLVFVLRFLCGTFLWTMEQEKLGLACPTESALHPALTDLTGCLIT